MRYSADVKKLIHYAHGLGLSVRFKPSLVDSDGYYCSKHRRIVVCSRGQSQTGIALILLHELGHHLDFIHKGKTDSMALIDALTRSELRRPTDPPLARSHRKLIYRCELDAVKYMPIIAKQLDLTIPAYKIYAEMNLDKWIARRFYYDGDYPSVNEIKLKRKELRKKWKKVR